MEGPVGAEMPVRCDPRSDGPIKRKGIPSKAEETPEEVLN